MWYNAPTMLPAGNLDEVELATSRQHRWCVIPQALVRMGEIIA